MTTFRKASASFVLCVFFVLICVQQSFGLDSRYLRNGECYLLIGDTGAHQGVYRMNNPSKQLGLKVGRLYNPYTSIGLSVDLERNIYTFSEKIAAAYTQIPGNIPRQVVDDTVSANSCGWGYHAYEHYDHRNNYGAGQAGREVYRTHGAQHSVGPGIPISAPSGNQLPPGDTIYPGKQWYSIPNGVWFSSWDTHTAVGWQKYSYAVYWDRVEGKAHNWKLMLWKDSMGEGTPPVEGNIVGTTYDLRFNRAILNACLDGCGGATGNYLSDAKPMYSSVAFMPPTLKSPSRTYLYSRQKDATEYSMSISVGGGTPAGYTGSIIGNPNDFGPPIERGTRWIGVSARDTVRDWVYAVSTPVIESWYKQATGSTTTMLINALTVSNQWNEKGGIVFAYDKNKGCAYKFARDETAATPITNGGYDVLDLGKDIDDIKADGFGSLYFAKTVSSPTMADPRGNFDMKKPRLPGEFNPDADVIKIIPVTTSGGVTWGNAIFAQEFRKDVYERAISDGSISLIGSASLGFKYYALNFSVSAASYSMVASSTVNFGTNLVAAGGNGLKWVSANPPYPDTLVTPDRTELAAINVPTPPKVCAFPGYKSHVDIIGPYSEYPPPDLSHRNTNQSANLIDPPTSALEPGTLYFYMVENYPLSDGPQNPVAQDNWNGNSFYGSPYLGGFVSTLVDPRSSVDGGRVFYRWILWTVKDGFDQVVKPTRYPENVPDYDTDSGQTHAFGFYSPVGGKYILTCQVKFDWYNYDELPFGSLYSDRESVRKDGWVAESPGRDLLVDAVQNTPDFDFMKWATMTTELKNNIIPTDAWAAIPINVSTNTEKIIPPTMYAMVQRWNIQTDKTESWNPEPANPWDPDIHYVKANATYAWRIAISSQALLFADLSKAGNPVSDQLLNPKSPLYANGKYPDLQFWNAAGDVRWADDYAWFSGSIVATMPSGSQKVFPIFGGQSQIRSDVATYGIGAITIPTDPKDAYLEIVGRRMFAYKLRPYNKIKGIFYPAFEVQNSITIVARTRIVAIDTQAPFLAEERTSPCNMFGFTGDKITAGIGPKDMGNPDNLNFVIGDDNPWENGPDDDNGIIDAKTLADNIKWNKSDNGISSYNLKPIYARTLSRKTVLAFESAVDTGTHTTSIGTFSHNFEQYYTSVYDKLPTTYLYWEPMNTPDAYSKDLGAASSYAYIHHWIGLVTLFYTVNEKNEPQNKLPYNYANNSPGYRPLKFFVTTTDSSGNIATYTLNTVMNLRDNIPPILWGTLISKKDVAVTSVFPEFSGNATSGLVFYDQKSHEENIAPQKIDWVANEGGDIGKSGDFENMTPKPKVLKILDSDAVKAFNDNILTNQIKSGIQPGYQEDNVVFEAFAFVSDNVGNATNTMTLKYFMPDGVNVGTWITTSTRPWPPKETKGLPIVGVFRGMPGDFPMGLKLKMDASDDAKDWNYIVDSKTGSTNWSNSTAVKLMPAAPTVLPNQRTLTTTIPVYDSRMIIRTLEKSIRNKD